MPPPKTKNWIAVSPSRFPWEQEALDFVYENFPASPEYLAWSNFEFIAANGSINEADLLIASPWGVFLIEIKSRPGRLMGDNASWTWIGEDGRRWVDDNPLPLANLKTKRLKDLLGRQPAFRNRDVPFIQPLVFCSAPGLDFQLPPDARNFICVRDNEEKGRPGIRAAIFHRQGAGLRPFSDRPVHGPTLKAFAQAMAQAGLRKQHRKVADFILDHLRYESPTGVFQDWEAHHSSSDTVRRLVRLYLTAGQATKEDRHAIVESSKREFHTLEKLNHPSILKALVPAESELGPAIVFEFDPTAQRLDHFLAQHGAKLDVGCRLELLRQVAEAVRYAHGKKVVHRALSPESVFVLLDKAGQPRVQIYNWHTGGRLAEGSFPGLTNLTLSVHAERMMEEPSRAYLAPETMISGEEPSESMDVFSLGALAYYLFGGQAPALDAAELEAKLKASPSRSLDVREILDGVSENIAALVRESTRASIVERCSLEDFLAHLDLILEELTRPENEVVDPHQADKGDVLSNGFSVERVLGRGASAKALLVKKGDSRCVLKVAKDRSFNRRLEVEFETLKKLSSPNIVKVFDRYELNGLTTFSVELAGERTLSRLLKEEGPPDLELLQRYGEDLIRAVDYLDQQGIFHRDIKPENIGIAAASGARSQRRLRLFDFSLASAPPTELRVGTPDYIDPFLEDRKARRYDLSAELYAVAMTLHELATGERARWKGGQPRLTDEQITLHVEVCDPNVRDQFTNFFRTGLHRDYRKRFDNTQEMLRAWSGIFETVDRPTTAHSEHEQPAEVISDAVLAAATLDYPIPLLQLSTRLLNVLDRLGVHTVGELLQFSGPGQFNKFRGVGRKTQREFFGAIHRLRLKFPKTGGVEIAPQAPEAFAIGRETIDILAQHALLGKKGKASQTESVVLHPFLGWDIPESTDSLAWPSQSDLVKVCRITRQRIGQIVTAARDRWKKSSLIGRLRDAIAELLWTRGGVMTQREVAAALLAARGSALEEPRRSQSASVATRAAVEAEHAGVSPRFEEYRSGDHIFLALHPDLRAYAVKLGEKADELAALDPLPTPARVLEELRAVPFPEEVPQLSLPTEARLRQLAVAAASQADLSVRGEVYPPGLEPRRALALARNAMFGDELTVAEIERRLRARLPRCGALPPRPQLDELLAEAGFEMDWDPLAANGEGAYKSRHKETLSISYSPGSRQVTRGTLSPAALHDPEVAEAAGIENRLRHSVAEGGYLILTVEPSQLERARAELAGRFDLDACDLDDLFLESLRAEAERVGASWDVVLAADARAHDSTDWLNLQRLVERALPGIESHLRSRPRTCLALHPGLLARYGHMNLIAALAADVGRAGGPRGLWILAPDNGQHTLPTLNGVPIPITNAAQHTRLTSAWLRNEHRGSSSSPIGHSPCANP
jgi:serine/threonine protein kinase